MIQTVNYRKVTSNIANSNTIRTTGEGVRNLIKLMKLYPTFRSTFRMRLKIMFLHLKRAYSKRIDTNISATLTYRNERLESIERLKPCTSSTTHFLIKVPIFFTFRDLTDKEIIIQVNS